jgi:hypothetical protein
MKRTGRAALLWLLAAGVLAAQDKTELRCAFMKGEKFPLKITYALAVKLDKVPDLLQGVVSEDPVDLKFEGTLSVEVVDVKEGGVAVLKGEWRTVTAKGHMMVNDIDFRHDASKAEEAKPQAKKEGDEPGLPGFDLQDSLKRMVKEPLTLSVDPRGRVTLPEGGAGRLGEIEGPLRSLNGLMGPLPEKKLGKGDSWREEVKLGMPGVGGNVDLKIATENTVESADADAVVIASKYALATKAAGEEPAPGIQVKMKTEGGGEGKLTFRVREGRPTQSRSMLKVRVSAVVPNPGGGDDLDLKASVKMEMGHELGGR